MFGPDGLVSRLLNFIQTLVGFYIAGLAVIASFNNPDMDRLMSGTPPTLTVVYNGKSTQVQATRRRFLCAMFAYLTAISFLITLVSIALLSLAVPAANLIPAAWHLAVKLGTFFFYVLAVGQLTLVTFWGLYYMGEKMLTPDT